MSNEDEKLRLVTRDHGVIPKGIVDLVQREAARVVPTLERGRPYRTEVVCAAIWGALTKAEHKDAGRALKHLASRGTAQLRYVGMDSSHHALYVRVD